METPDGPLELCDGNALSAFSPLRLDPAHKRWRPPPSLREKSVNCVAVGSVEKHPERRRLIQAIKSPSRFIRRVENGTSRCKQGSPQPHSRNRQRKRRTGGPKGRRDPYARIASQGKAFKGMLVASYPVLIRSSRPQMSRTSLISWLADVKLKRNWSGVFPQRAV